MYALSFVVLAYSWFSWWDLIKDREHTVTSELWKAVGGNTAAPSLLPPWLGLFALFALAFTYLFLFAANRIRPRSQDRTSLLRMITFLALLAALGWGVSRMPRQAGDPQAAFEAICLWTAAGLFVAGLLFTSEPADVSGRLRRRFGRWRGLRYPLRIFAPGPFWALVYSLVLGITTFTILWVVCARFQLQAGADVLAAGAKGIRYDQALVTAPLYLFTFAALGFYLSSLDFSPTYSALTVSFIFIITLLLPVIFHVGQRPDGIFSFYYLSPITLWSSLSPPTSNEGPRYVLYGVPIIQVAQVLFASLGVLFTLLGARASRRKGYPLLRFNS
jgi:hypothetical protein